jgi:hypothetical protein
MEKWSFQRIRELMTHIALRGMAANELGRARISMMVRSISSNTATPSSAQGVYFQGPGFGVEVGRPAYRERYYRGYHDYNYYDSRERLRGGCRTVTIEPDDGSVRRIRRCD